MVTVEEWTCIFMPKAVDEFKAWIRTISSRAGRVVALVNDIMGALDDGYAPELGGLPERGADVAADCDTPPPIGPQPGFRGRPIPLIHELPNVWSRQVSLRNRMIYCVERDKRTVVVFSLRGCFWPDL